MGYPSRDVPGRWRACGKEGATEGAEVQTGGSQREETSEGKETP